VGGAPHARTPASRLYYQKKNKPRAIVTPSAVALSHLSAADEQRLISGAVMVGVCPRLPAVRTEGRFEVTSLRWPRQGPGFGPILGFLVIRAL